MRRLPNQLAVPLTLAALFLGGVALMDPAPADAQCLPESECDALKQELRSFRAEARAARQELRQIRRQIRALPQDSPEREALIERARGLRREARQRRQEARPVIQSLRAGCRGC